MQKLILIAGYVAGGKTVFSQRLAERLHLPVFNKDKMKAALGKFIPIANRDDSRQLSRATFGMMVHIAENLMKTNTSFILESNFTESEADLLQKLLNQYHYQALTFVFVGNMKVIHQRFIARDNSPEREEANRSHGLFNDYDVFREGIEPLGNFSVGDLVIRVDTTDFATVDFGGYIQTACSFLTSEPPK